MYKAEFQQRTVGKDSVSHRALLPSSWIAQISLRSYTPATGTARSVSELVVGAINRALQNMPRDRVRLHVCWGNYEGPHDCDVHLDDILPVLLEANIGPLVLPFANPRHAHASRLPEPMPLASDQLSVAGVIDTPTNFVEHPHVVANRIERVAATIGDPSGVLAGTDCGFDTSAGMGRVAEDVVWAKLRSPAEGARTASRRPFAS